MEANFRNYSSEELLGPLNEVEQKNAPSSLFVCGDLGLLKNGPRVSVVGSRRVSDYGRRLAGILAENLVSHEAVVVSGLAQGVDTEAHVAALKAGGRTIAVLGTPLSESFPKENRALQERIMREHLAVSQFPPGSATGRGNFPMRNRTMALISDATVIVEAGESSGTIHQGWEALRLGRPLFICEPLVSEARFGWVHEMIEYGAEALSVDTIDFLLEFLPERSDDEDAGVAL